MWMGRPGILVVLFVAMSAHHGLILVFSNLVHPKDYGGCPVPPYFYNEIELDEVHCSFWVFKIWHPVRCSISYQPKTHADPQLAMGPSREDLVIIPACKVGVGSSIPGSTNCERTWKGPGISIHGFTAQPQFLRPK